MIESVHRTMNEVTLRRADDRNEATMTSECECDRAECGHSFPITVTAYESVRASGRRFVVAPGHERRDEPVLSRACLYVVVEKLGLHAQAAEALNPR